MIKISKLLKSILILLILLEFSNILSAEDCVIKMQSLILSENKSNNFSLISQDSLKNKTLPKNCIYIEFLGNGFLGSLNYERELFYNIKGNYSFTIRLGAFFIPSKPVFSFPALLNNQIRIC